MEIPMDIETALNILMTCAPPPCPREEACFTLAKWVKERMEPAIAPAEKVPDREPILIKIDGKELIVLTPELEEFFGLLLKSMHSDSSL
jgi:hypothetical protein